MSGIRMDPPVADRNIGVDRSIAASDGYTVSENAALQERNTLRLAARAGRLIDVRDLAVLERVLGDAALVTQPLLVLGAGSNIVFTRDWPGSVLSIAAHGITILDDDGEVAHVRVEAGADWNDFVRWSLDHGFAGLENLSLIPGTVGAAPIQNIGAYGVEVGEFTDTVEAWDRIENKLVRINIAACAFGYRDSVFKRHRDRYIVTAVEFALPRASALHIDYPGVREELATMGVSEPDPLSVSGAIVRIRTRKLPNPALLGNAGSFFKNPLIDTPALGRVLSVGPAVPHWPAANGLHKISAAWLIEACGLKGFREGAAAVSDQHSLVLVNHGGATGAQIGALAQHVRDRVCTRFGIEIEVEPHII